MVSELADVPREVWKTAVDRLSDVGVFADEERKFPSLPTLRRELAQFEMKLRSEDYKGGALAIDEVDQPGEGVNFLVFDRDKIGDARSAAAAWYREYQDRWHRRVGDSVRDWIRRLEDLKETMGRWLPSGMSIFDLPPIRMHEELMRKFNVQAASMPTFEVHEGQRKVMRVQPKGLWIIGANGRVDLITATSSLILVDQSEPYSDTPDWRYYAPNNRRKPTQFDQAAFIELLK
ncbi:MAG: hypothetical protein WAM29_04135 [Methylocella sp.]